MEQLLSIVDKSLYIQEPVSEQEQAVFKSLCYVCCSSRPDLERHIYFIKLPGRVGKTCKFLVTHLPSGLQRLCQSYFLPVQVVVFLFCF